VASEAVMVDEVASEVVVGVDSVVEAVEVAEAAEDVEATLMVKAARNFKTTNQNKKKCKLQEQNSTTVHEKNKQLSRKPSQQNDSVLKQKTL
jgi:hypothetical protein